MGKLSFIKQYVSEDVIWLITTILLPAAVGILGNLATPTVKNLYYYLSRKSIEGQILSLEKELDRVKNLSESLQRRDMLRLMAMLGLITVLLLSCISMLSEIINKLNNTSGSFVAKYVNSSLIVLLFFTSFRLMKLNHMAMNYEKYSAIISSKINKLRSKLQ